MKQSVEYFAAMLESAENEKKKKIESSLKKTNNKEEKIIYLLRFLPKMFSLVKHSTFPGEIVQLISKRTFNSRRTLEEAIYLNIIRKIYSAVSFLIFAIFHQR